MPGNNEPSPKKGAQAGRGLVLGLLFGAALGVVLWLVTDTFVFFPVFVGAGLSIGLALDNAQSEKDGEV
ncbi:MAG: hypothetical protein PVH65_04945 [Chloroflexota bacterium]|jgi:hypothetical protein